MDLKDIVEMLNRNDLSREDREYFENMLRNYDQNKNKKNIELEIELEV